MVGGIAVQLTLSATVFLSGWHIIKTIIMTDSFVWAVHDYNKGHPLVVYVNGM